MFIRNILVLTFVLFSFSLFADPLYNMIERCSLPDVICAIERGADVNQLDAMGRSPLDVALAIERNSDGLDAQSLKSIRAIIAELKARGAQAREQTRAQHTGQYTLTLARRVRTGRMPETLIAHGPVLYVANEGSNDVDVILANPQRPVRTVRVGEGPRILAVTNGLLFIANHRSDTITVIDTVNDHRVASTVHVGEGPFAGVVVGDLLYVTILHTNRIVAISRHTLRVEYQIEVGRAPQSIVAANGFLFVTGLNGELVVVDIKTRQVAKRIPVGLLEHPPVLLGEFLFFENQNAPGLAVLDTRHLEIVANVPVGQGARVLAGQNDVIYVTTRNTRDIHVINWRRPLEALPTIPLDEAAAGAFLYRNMLFIRHANSPYIQVFNVAQGHAFARILAAIQVGSCMALELLGHHLCVSLRTGFVVLLDLEQLTRISELDAADAVHDIGDEEQPLEMLIEGTELARRRDLMWQ